MFAGILFLFAYGQCLKNDDVTTLLVEEVRSLKKELAMLRNECDINLKQNGLPFDRISILISVLQSKV